jgi:hypothetical protein
MGPPGHFGIAFAAKPAAPKAPLWVFLLASWILDLLCFGFEAIGLESFDVSETTLEQGVKVIIPGSVPYSHGLFMSFVWSIIFGLVAFLVYRDRKTSLILGLVVFSHWILDFVVHIPDLPLFLEGSPLLGLGLWGSGPGLIASSILEFALLAGGLAIYFVFRKQNQSQVA